MFNVFTIGNLIGFLVLFVGGIIIGGIICAVRVVDGDLYDEKKIAKPLIKTMALTLAITLLLIIVFAVPLGIYNTKTASGERALKDSKSEINKGINREIIITAEDGREIFHYEGKVDIESNHEDNYIKCEGEDGKRYIIYYGIQDTITIIEK